MEENPAKLSKNVLMMKFMQRSVLRMEVEQNEEEKQRVIDDEHWVLDLPQLTQREEKFVVQPSYITCENLQYGRMSFKGFNPEVEKLMKIHNTEAELQQAEEREKEIGVSESEMTNRYSTLVGIISKKFSTKRKMGEEPGEKVDKEEEEDDDQLITTTTTPPKSKKGKRKFMKPDDS
ncbi:M-phase phosphoprotein 6-like [Littorina saxatilis]|uniref:M-phase phosphoprotein 6 n=1 Tax=Littorina saxatilis TaxID=31220 RepID=A0AAN9GQ29_9CAEN